MFDSAEFKSDREALYRIWEKAKIEDAFPEKWIDSINQNTRSLLSRYQTYALCGLTPFCKNAVRILKEKEAGSIVIIDEISREKDFEGIPIVNYENMTQADSSLFIVCSRTIIDEHIKKIPANAAVIGYHSLLLADAAFDLRAFDFTRDKMTEQLYHTLKYMDSYRDLLNRLADDRSRYLLQRILLFRLTLDIRLNLNVGSEYIHYFDEDIIQLTEKESFVDAGGYTGDTLELFLKLTGNQFEHYYLFEPEKELINKARCVTSDKRVAFYNYGLADQQGVVKFKAGTEGSGSVSKDGEIEIQLVKLDDLLKNSPVTFIKMDIEGSELSALNGAERIIREQKPKLAVCLYHKIEDILQIADYINGVWNGQGLLYLRAEKDNVDQQYLLYAIHKSNKRI